MGQATKGKERLLAMHRALPSYRKPRHVPDRRAAAVQNVPCRQHLEPALPCLPLDFSWKDHRCGSCPTQNWYLRADIDPDLPNEMARADNSRADACITFTLGSQ